MTEENPTPIAANNQTLRDLANSQNIPTPAGVRPAPHRVGAAESGAEYVLLGNIGRGGMSEIVAATHVPTNREVALKLMLNEAGVPSDHDRLRLLWEAQAIAKLEHPAIIPLYDIGYLHDGTDADSTQTPFYAMRKLPAGSTWLERLAAFSVIENLDILNHVCNAVAFAHSRGILHRDLKPDNVLLGDFGEVFVTDWGLAASWGMAGCDHAHARALEEGGLYSIGSPSYSAPELANQDNAATGIWTDVYLLGAILFHIVSGSPPHGTKTTPNLLRNAQENRIVEEKNIPPELERLYRIARKAMNSKPEKRHLNVKEFQADLHEWRKHWDGLNLLRLGREEMERAKAGGGYKAWDRAARFLSSARDLDPTSVDVAVTEREVALGHAAFALRFGDLDVAKAKLPPPVTNIVEDEDTKNLRAELLKRLTHRFSRERRVKQLKWGLASLAAVALVAFGGMGLWMAAEAERSRQLILRNAGELYDNARLVRRQSRFEADKIAVNAEQRFAEAGERRQALEFFLWDSSIANEYPLESRQYVPPDMTKTGALDKQTLPAPFDGSASLPPHLEIDSAALAAYPSGAKPRHVLYADNNPPTISRLSSLDETGRILEHDVYHVALGSRESVTPAIHSARFLDNGDRFAVLLADGTELKYPLRKDKARRLPFFKTSQTSASPLPEESLYGVPTTLLPSLDGGLVVVIDDHGAVSLVDFRKWRRVGYIASHLMAASLPPEKNTLVETLCWGYQVPKRRPVAAIRQGDNSLLALARGRDVVLISLPDGQATPIAPCPDAVEALHMMGALPMIAYTAEATYKFRNGEWKQLATLPPPPGWVTVPGRCAVAKTGGLILRQVADPAIVDAKRPWRENGAALECWNPNEERLLWSKPGVNCGALAVDVLGTVCAIWDAWALEVRVYRMADGELLHTFANHKMPVVSMAFSWDDDLLAVSDLDKTLSLYYLPEEKEAFRWVPDYAESTQRYANRELPNLVCFSRFNTLLYTDVNGQTAEHLFSSIALHKKDAGLIPAGGCATEDEDNPFEDEDYRMFAGGMLVDTLLPYVLDSETFRE